MKKAEIKIISASRRTDESTPGVLMVIKTMEGLMKRFMLSVVLVLVVVVALVSVSHAQPREEITLTTIVPDQTVLIVKKGVVGYNYHRAAAANPLSLIHI